MVSQKFTESPFKERFNNRAINSAFKKLTENFEGSPEDLNLHFVYAGYYYWLYDDRLRSFIQQEMKKYKIKSVMLTAIYMMRLNLITKEAMKNYCKGEEFEKVSVNDDLEGLFKDLRLGKEPNTLVRTYFLRKLSQEELGLVDNKDQNYFETFFRFLNPDVSLEELNQSESKSKYVKGVSSCRTYVIYISEDSDLSGSDSETLYITVKTTRACCNSCCYLL